jgi:pentatricopeptide repeat protein
MKPLDPVVVYLRSIPELPISLELHFHSSPYVPASCVVQAGQVDHVVRLLGRMVDSGVRPSAYTFIMAVMACLNAKDLKALPQVFDAMNRAGTRPDERLFRVGPSGQVRDIGNQAIR